MKRLTDWQNQEIFAGNNDRHDSMISKPRRDNEFYMRGWKMRDLTLSEWASTT